MLFASVCAVCGTPGRCVCPPCAAQLRRPGPVVCPAGLDACTSLLDYDGPGRELVLALKYGNRRAVVRPLGRALALLVAGPVDVVTWVPTTPRRRRERGYDQARLLAREVARGLGRPCRSLLRRAPGPPQTGRSLAERQRGPVLTARRRADGIVLVVDDVVTTGASLAAAAATLRGGGARGVQGVTVAATAAQGGSRPRRKSPQRPPRSGRSSPVCR